VTTTSHAPRKDVAEADASSRYGLLMSIQPRYANAILAGEKTVELRRRPPRNEPPVVIIYSSGKAREVLGTARLKDVHTSTPADIWAKFGAGAGVTRAEFDAYFAGSETATAIEVEAPRRTTDPLTLANLRTFDLEPPQSWRYVDRERTTDIVEALFRTGAQKRRPRASTLRHPTSLVALNLLDVTFAGITTTLSRPLHALAESARCARSFATGPTLSGIHRRSNSTSPRRDNL
jgi:predicted transcriptional regulator